MLSRILVPMDGSEMAERALEYAIENHPGAEITVLHVVGEPSPMWGAATGLALEDDIDAAAKERAHPIFERVAELAAEHDVEITTTVKLGSPIRAILNAAGEFDAVIIGSHGGTMADRLFIGNVAQKVFRRSPVPVVVVR